MFRNVFPANAGAGEVLVSILLIVIPFMICITVHELAHGFTAYRLGDNTAKNQGRLTLNPIRHIDPFGLLMIVVFRFGWAKPVPVNMNTFKHPRRYMAVTAFAGPLSNLILALVLMFLYGILLIPILSINTPGVADFIHTLFLQTIWISVMLAVFNLLPIPPLDGSKILFSLVSEETYFKLMRYERYGFFVLILLLNIPVFQNTLRDVIQTIYDSFFLVGQAALSLVA
ncbi:MAG: site-2 protease family protein [Oscillospiraceae bacterium]|nr:site-2 protease family protein [Oscillospiraceae bacterium]